MRPAERIVHQHELDLGVDQVVGIVEIAERLGVAQQTASAWKHRGLLPPPRWHVSRLGAWYWPDIEQWAHQTGRLPKTTLA